MRFLLDALGSYGSSAVVTGLVLLVSERFLLRSIDESVNDPAVLRASLDERLFGLLFAHVLAVLFGTTITVWQWHDAEVLAKGFCLGFGANVAILVAWRLGMLKSSIAAARAFGAVTLVFTSAFAILSGRPFDATWRWSAGPLFAFFVALTASPTDGWIYAAVLTLTSLLPGAQPAWFSTVRLEQEAVHVPMVMLFFVLVLVTWKMRDVGVVYHVLERTFAEKTKAKDMFISTVSHEIRTPLHGIVASVEMMRDEPNRRRQEEHLENISHCASVLSLLVDNVLTMGSPEAAAKQARVPVVMGNFVEKLRSIVRSLAVTSRVSVRMSCDDHVPRIMEFADAAVMQILINLCGNAIKYTQREGGVIDVHFGMCADSRLRCIVSDNGSGVPFELQPKLFQPYVRGTQPGTGLGLYISKRLAESLGGTIAYMPKEGDGSVFSLEIPVSVASEEGTIGEHRARRQTSFRGSKSVTAQATAAAVVGAMVDASPVFVIVEDNVMNQRVLLGYLRRLNTDPVAVLSDGASALQWLLDNIKGRKQQRIMVLLDIGMPVMDGLVTAKLWRNIEAEYPNRPEAKIFLVTASQLNFVPPFVNGVLMKPLALERLRAVL